MAKRRALTVLGNLETVPATHAKNSFGSVLDKVIAGGTIAITKHGEIRAVLLSAREYAERLSPQSDPLHALLQEFDGLVGSMRKPSAKRAGRALFDATAIRLGRAAVANACRRA